MVHDEATKGVFGLALIGALVGLGQLLASKEVLTPRVVAGRAICSGALGMAAAAVLSFIPALPFPAQMGIAATISSLGTSALERLFQRVTSGGV
jgi:membrane protein implicated in regulation of membrane protease activity